MVRVTLAWLVASASLTAQGDDIYQRVQQALEASGQAEAALSELQSQNFELVNKRLGGVKPASDAERAELLALRGAIAFLAGHMKEAASAFGESEKIHPAKETDRFTRAMALVKLGDDGHAREILTSLAGEHQGSALYSYWLGRLDYDQRRYGEAVENLRRATVQDPTAARAWDSLGLAWDMQGRLEQAHEAFVKAVSLNRAQKRPSPWPPQNLGYLLFRMGELTGAEDALRESLRYDAGLARTHYYLGRVLEKTGQDSAAAAEYQVAVNGDPATADACYSLAMLYRRLHRAEQANAMFAEFKRRKAKPTP